jgi:trehalose 6-phosphate synthase
MFTEENLKDFIKNNLSDYNFIVVSNKQPYEHNLQKGKVVCSRGSGGVITAIEPIMQASNGTWIAVGNGTADKKVVDKKNIIKVPTDNPKYSLKRIWLTKEENKRYYYGYSNEALWPLCHMAFQRPTFRKEDWEYYKNVNEKFCDAILEEIDGEKAFIWIQDYHLCLLPQMLKEKAKPEQLIIAHFWHIPWPNYEIFRICPQKEEILKGLLANDLLGFHITYHCNNFVDVIDREIEAKIDRENSSVIHNEQKTKIQAFPISIDFERINDLSKTNEVDDIIKEFKEEYSLNGQKVIVGAERIDYTKGIPERFMVIDRLLEAHPELIGKVTFLQLGQMSRIHIDKYKVLNDKLNSLVEEINWKYSTDNWEPIIFVRQNLNFKQLIALFKLSDVLVVSSLHDGMNLVAKEFIASRSDNNGVLVLSKFTGVARELTEAIQFNPYDLEDFCSRIYEALIMEEEEKQTRLEKMRQIVKEENIYVWAKNIMSELLKIEF